VTKQFLRAQIIYSVTREEGKTQGSKSRSSARGSFPTIPAPNAFNAISFQQSHTKLFESRPYTHCTDPLLQREQKQVEIAVFEVCVISVKA
jgi:hypothetical protein